MESQGHLAPKVFVVKLTDQSCRHVSVHEEGKPMEIFKFSGNHTLKIGGLGGE